MKRNKCSFTQIMSILTKYQSNSQWNRLANLVIGNALATDILASAKFYAQLNYALANAAIASWDSK